MNLRRQARFLLLLLMPALTAQAQQPDIVYHLGWSAPNSHYFEITMEISNHEAEAMDVRIPSWRPGRYILQNYARNVIGFTATDGNGTALPVHKADRDTWRIEKGQAEKVVVSYQSYARELDGGASYLGESEAYLNPITSLMNVKGRDLEPALLILHKPDDWRVATALNHNDEMGGYWAEDYHELIDSPVLISPSFKLLSFEESGGNIEIAIQGDWAFDEAGLIDDHRQIVRAQIAMMGDVPFDRYLFMYHMVPFRIGHGVEHKNSTSIVLGPASSVMMPNNPDQPTFYSAMLSVASHEFFHLWNVERIRPAVMAPPDYSTENYTTQMWIYEGVTDYFSDVLLYRAGLITERVLLRRLSNTLRSFDTNLGRKVTSIAATSWDSWSKQGEAPPHTFYSFYTAGKAMGLMLDLEVRGRTENRVTLDDVMRYLNTEYAQKDRGVPEDGFQEALEHLTGTSFQDFFDAHIYGTEDVDYNRYLAHAGLVLEMTTDPRRPAVSLGASFNGDNEVTDVRPGGTAFRAGLDFDDRLLALDSTLVDNNLTDLLHTYQPGDNVEVKVDRWGQERTFSATFDAAPPSNYTITKTEETTALQNAIRSGWLKR